MHVCESEEQVGIEKGAGATQRSARTAEGINTMVLPANATNIAVAIAVNLKENSRLFPLLHGMEGGWE